MKEAGERAETGQRGGEEVGEGRREVGETGEGASRARRGYFTQSPQRAEVRASAQQTASQRGGGPRYARHGSRGARFTSATHYPAALVKPSASRSMCRP